jgi:glycerol-3-phosphate acyltransferase PlsX
LKNYGGTRCWRKPPVIVGHGISHEKAFMNMILLAVKMIDSDLMGKMKSAFPGDNLLLRITLAR